MHAPGLAGNAGRHIDLSLGGRFIALLCWCGNLHLHVFGLAIMVALILALLAAVALAAAFEVVVLARGTLPPAFREIKLGLFVYLRCRLCEGGARVSEVAAVEWLGRWIHAGLGWLNLVCVIAKDCVCKVLAEYLIDLMVAEIQRSIGVHPVGRSLCAVFCLGVV